MGRDGHLSFGRDFHGRTFRKSITS
jgi:hypothetical protein